MLNSIEQEISTAQKNLREMLKIKTFLAFKTSYVILIILINVEIPIIVGILTLMIVIFVFHCESQWQVGGALKLGSKGCLFETHRSHCFVFLSKTYLSVPK